MKIIVLAAGIGSRLGKSYPKALTSLIDNKSILAHQIAGLSHYVNVDDIFVVVGYKQNMIIKSFPEVSFLFNNQYKTTNTSQSLLIGLNELEGNDIIWLNGDIYFDHRVISKIIDSIGSCMAVNRAMVGVEEVKYRTNDQGFVVEISKEVYNPEGESLGIHKIPSNEVPILAKYLSDCQENDYFEKGLELAIQSGLKVTPVDISDLTCIEIDFHEDLEAVNNILRLNE